MDICIFIYVCRNISTYVHIYNVDEYFIVKQNLNRYKVFVSFYKIVCIRITWYIHC